MDQRASRWLPEQGEPPTAPGPHWDGGCPYRGLLPFDQAHAPVFFGRERLTAELAGMLGGTGIVIVTGASGAGKTSLLRAGLVPALARGVQVPGSAAWPVVSLTVTARPLTDLAADPGTCTPRASAGTRPARSSEVLPAPEAPVTTTIPAPVSLPASSAVSRSRPQNTAACAWS